jgi:hypothetical protein
MKIPITAPEDKKRVEHRRIPDIKSSLFTYACDAY